VARSLLAELVAPAPADADVDAWAARLVEEEWSIERTLAALLRSELFFSPAARRARIAGPVELVARTVITLGARIAPAVAARAAEAMGQSLLRPPSVKGWDGGRAWIHTGSWLARHDALTRLALGEEARGVDLAAAYGAPATRDDAVAAACALLVPDVEDATLAATLRDAAASAPSHDEALRRVTALILTAPEYHLV
jgi:uncharacterized protein (DUF1800 family)